MSILENYIVGFFVGYAAGIFTGLMILRLIRPTVTKIIKEKLAAIDDPNSDYYAVNKRKEKMI